MKTILKYIKKEYLIFSLLASFIVLMRIFDKEYALFNWQEIPMLLLYFIAALFINYILLPKLFYRDKTKLFAILFLLIIVLLSVFEELVFEKFFYPETKGIKVYIGLTIIEISSVLILLVGFKFGWDRYEEHAKLEQLKRLVAESELQNINSQISPHFLFNNLNTLYAYAIEESSKTPELILQLSGILRYMLYDCKEKRVPLQKEIENLTNFINLYKIQLGNRANIDFTFSKVSEEINIAPLIFIVFVENAFKHSMSSQIENILIKIQFEINNNKLRFYCENNFSPNTNNDGLTKGIGLHNVKSRLNIFYKNKYTMQHNTEGGLYKVTLNIEL